MFDIVAARLVEVVDGECEDLVLVKLNTRQTTSVAIPIHNVDPEGVHANWRLKVEVLASSVVCKRAARRARLVVAISVVVLHFQDTATVEVLKVKGLRSAAFLLGIEES